MLNCGAMCSRGRDAVVLSSPRALSQTEMAAAIKMPPMMQFGLILDLQVHVHAVAPEILSCSFIRSEDLPRSRYINVSPRDAENQSR